MDYIPLEDVAYAYAKLSDEKKSAVTNLIRGDEYVSIVGHNNKGEHSVTLDWQAGQVASIHLIAGAVMTGRSEFGRLWLEELNNQLSQIT